MLLPFTHVHSSFDGLNSQRSLSQSPPALDKVESNPAPPNSHRFPLLSIQPFAFVRPPGTLDVDATPIVPYCPTSPARGPLAPDIQVHCPLVGLKFQRSFKRPTPLSPPNSQRLPLLSIQPTAPVLLPATLVMD